LYASPSIVRNMCETTVGGMGETKNACKNVLENDHL